MSNCALANPNTNKGRPIVRRRSDLVVACPLLVMHSFEMHRVVALSAVHWRPESPRRRPGSPVCDPAVPVRLVLSTVGESGPNEANR